jgi:DNA-binding MarR family transcriptional regulator
MQDDPLRAWIKQKRPFAAPEHEAVLAIRMVGARLLAPWEQFLDAEAGLTVSQYNVLRILRGSHPARLTCGDISGRTIARGADVTRLVDRLHARGLVKRTRGTRDRRVVEVGISEGGLQLLRTLDPHANRMPKALIGHMSKSKLRTLTQLMAQLLDGMGTFP